MAIVAPLKTIGEVVLFDSGVEPTTDGGKNGVAATNPALITIAGAKLLNGEWHYFESFDPLVLYPESGIIT